MNLGLIGFTKNTLILILVLFRQNFTESACTMHKLPDALIVNFGGEIGEKGLCKDKFGICSLPKQKIG